MRFGAAEAVAVATYEDSPFGVTPDEQIRRSVPDARVAASLVTAQRNMRYIVGASAFGAGAVLFGLIGYFVGRGRR